MDPIKKAAAMVSRWHGNRQIAISVAEENRAIHQSNGDGAKVKFWNAVLRTLKSSVACGA
jgi:hypothetical protein